MADKLNKKISMPVAPQPSTPKPTPEQQKEARFQAFSQQWLSENIYVPPYVPEQFAHWFWLTFSNFSASGLRIAHNLYNDILRAEQYTYNQYNIVLQLFSMVNGAQLQCSRGEYLEFQDACRLMESDFTEAQLKAVEIMRKEFDDIESVMATNEVGQA